MLNRLQQKTDKDGDERGGSIKNIDVVITTYRLTAKS